MADIPSIGIWELLFQQQQRPFPADHVIFRSFSNNKAYTYDNVRTQAERFGRALQRSDWRWRKGDVLMVMSPNSIEMPPVIWGCHYAGGIVVPVNPELSAAELRHQLEDSGAKALVVHPQCIQTAVEVLRLAEFPRENVLVLDNNSHGLRMVGEFVAEALAAGTEAAGCCPINPAEDLAYLVYSSGTTGKPKGVMISHRNVVSAVLLQSKVESAHINWRNDRMLAVLPLYHIYGLICLMHLPLWFGIPTVFMEKFDLAAFCRIVQECAITHAYVAPPVVLHLAKNQIVDRYDLKSLCMLTSGGAPLAAALIDELYQKHQIPVRQAYGLSETTSVSHIQHRSHWRNGIGSNGPPLPGLEVKFVRQNGSVAAVQEEGELWVRGPTVFNGYRNEPTMTAQSLTIDGWFKTGRMLPIEFAAGNRSTLRVTSQTKSSIPMTVGY